MVNYIWVGMLVVGVVFALFNGTMDQVVQALFQSANDAVTLCLSLLSVLVLWLGIMRIAQDSGLLRKLSALFRPLIRRLFPEIPGNHPALAYILSNMIANLFGLGNAATPLGLKAMEQMKELNGGKDTASRSMITFLVVNNTCITLVPTTIIALRMTHNARSPADIILPTLAATLVSAAVSVMLDRYYYYKTRKKG